MNNGDIQWDWVFEEMPNDAVYIVEERYKAEFGHLTGEDGQPYPLLFACIAKMRGAKENPWRFGIYFWNGSEVAAIYENHGSALEEAKAIIERDGSSLIRGYLLKTLDQAYKQTKLVYSLSTAVYGDRDPSLAGIFQLLEGRRGDQPPAVFRRVHLSTITDKGSGALLRAIATCKACITSCFTLGSGVDPNAARQWSMFFMARFPNQERLDQFHSLGFKTEEPENVHPNN